MDRIPLLAVNA